MSNLRPHRVTPVPLPALVAGLGLSGDVEAEVLVSGITQDSREASPGCLYVAVPGSRVHGARFAAAAAGLGAVAVLTDPAGAGQAGATGLPVLVSGRLRPDMAQVAARVFGEPADRLRLFGVTGTNGKTTTVAMLEAGLRAAGERVGTVGTFGFRLDGAALASDRSTVTTPDSPDLQALLAVMADGGAGSVAIEVSSHAMVHSRVDAIGFAVTGFLNLGRDHLDFHPDVEHYFEAKASLFTPERTGHAVCWVDDPRGAEVARRCAARGLPVTTVGTRDADVVLTDHRPRAPLGGAARVVRDGDQFELSIALPGFHNMVDAAVALTMLEAGGIPRHKALQGLAAAQVPGRMQALDLPGDCAPTVVVDFAHTPQAVSATLETLRAGFDHVITVVGCGGDRDPDKRPLMGAAAAAGSDVLIITDDNPRTEDPARIRAAVLAGARDEAGEHLIIRDVPGRRVAIEQAIAMAGRASVVAILGKGHEQGQIVGDHVAPFDDTVEARAAWERTREGKG